MSEFAFGMPLPPEVIADAQRQHDLYHMKTQAVRHDMFAFLDSLDEDQAKQFSLLVRVFAREEDSSYAKYIDGYFSGLRERKFGICPGCSVNHDQMPDDMRPNEPVESVVSDGSNKVTSVEEEASWINTDYVLTEADLERMNEYNLDDLRDEDDKSTLLGFICLGCGMRYISIADRMLRPPGIAGCSGCQLKSGHG